MTLSEVLRLYNKEFDVIEYRKIISVDSDDVDVLSGMASYKNKMLISLDGDTYSLNDEIIKHELYKNNWLVVWEQ